MLPNILTNNQAEVLFQIYPKDKIIGLVLVAKSKLAEVLGLKLYR